LKVFKVFKVFKGFLGFYTVYTFQRRLGKIVVDGGVCFWQVLVDGMFAGPLVTLRYDVYTADLYR